MQEKLKQLELWVTQALSRQKDLQGENASLKAKLRSLEGGAEKIKETETELRSLKEWKKNAQAILRRLSSRLEKEIAKAQEEEKKIV